MRKVRRNERCNLKAGTELSQDGVNTIILTSDYLPKHSGYRYNNTDINDEGEMVEIETNGIITINEVTSYYIY